MLCRNKSEFILVAFISFCALEIYIYQISIQNQAENFNYYNTLQRFKLSSSDLTTAQAQMDKARDYHVSVTCNPCDTLFSLF